jgi:hydroxymethylbilane synthase
MSAVKLRIGTRGSPLALWQAYEVRRLLAAAHGLAEDAIAIKVIRTSGDRIQDRPLSEVGGKGLFTKEIEEALLDGSIDLAVHSMKDVATVLPDGLVIPCLLPREDPRDAFISNVAGSLAELPEGAVVGTSSLRRQSQVRHVRPGLTVVSLRGNVDTRLRKIAEGEADATLLALAGLKRLGLESRAAAILSTDEMLPAVAQGAIGIEVRDADAATRAMLQPLHHADTGVCVAAERAFLKRLDGSCRTPIAALAELTGATLSFRGRIYAIDGRISHGAVRSGGAADAARFGLEAAEEVLAAAGDDFLIRTSAKS